MSALLNRALVSLMDTPIALVALVVANAAFTGFYLTPRSGIVAMLVAVPAALALAKIREHLFLTEAREFEAVDLMVYAVAVLNLLAFTLAIAFTASEAFRLAL